MGSEYAHAEARKSPVVDGVVNRSGDGKEIRFPVLLSRRQKKIAHDVALAFKQTVGRVSLLGPADEVLSDEVLSARRNHTRSDAV